MRLSVVTGSAGHVAVITAMLTGQNVLAFVFYCVFLAM